MSIWLPDEKAPGKTNYLPFYSFFRVHLRVFNLRESALKVVDALTIKL